MRVIESEKLIERKLTKIVKDKNGMCIKLLCNNIIGLPDRAVLFPNGVIAFVELKTTNQKPRRIQTSMHNKLRALGFRVEVIDSTEGVNKFIDSVLC